jgi:Spy/CpxP family protein refolding chaperone
MIRIVLSLVLALTASAALAQHHQPYAGQQSRGIKALSERETADLLAGRGMGLARAAELNSYPGPMHALEMAQALELNAAQVAALEDQKRRMAAVAIALGQKIVAEEGDLDRLFAEGRIDPASLQAQSEAIGLLQGQLRAVHLATHLETRAVLTDAQVQHYNELRGYGPAQPSGHRRHH